MANTEKPVKFEADIQWAFLNRKSEMSGKYQVDLCNLSAGAVKALEDVGLQPRKREDKPEKGWFITAKSNYEIKPFDKNGAEITDAVGNGSKAVAMIKPYHWSWKNKTGVSPSLSKITITDLVVYNSDSATADEEMDDEIPL
jgi:hypothetical protein